MASHGQLSIVSNWKFTYSSCNSCHLDSNHFICLDYYTNIWLILKTIFVYFIMTSSDVHCHVIWCALMNKIFVTRLAEHCPAQWIECCQSGHETASEVLLKIYYLLHTFGLFYASEALFKIYFHLLHKFGVFFVSVRVALLKIYFHLRPHLLCSMHQRRCSRFTFISFHIWCVFVSVTLLKIYFHLLHTFGVFFASEALLKI